MSLIKLSCSKCGRRLSTQAGLAGKKVRCPACKNIIVVPRIDPGEVINTPEHDAQTPTAPGKPEPETPVSTEPTSEADASPQNKYTLIYISKAIFHFSYAVGIITMGLSCPLNAHKGIGAAGAAFENGLEVTLWGWLIALILYLIGRKRSK